MHNILKIRLKTLNMSMQRRNLSRKAHTFSKEIYESNLSRRTKIFHGQKFNENLFNAKDPMKELEMAPRKMSQERLIVTVP